MRVELENVRGIMQKAANGARLYHEQISHVRKTCKPDVIVKETETYAKPLKEAMEKAASEIQAQLSELEARIKKASMLDPKSYNKDTVDLIRTMKPDAEELEAIAEQYKGNETMLRFFHKYREENKLIVNLPLCGADKLKHVKLMRDDLTYVLGLAGEPFSETNRYADAQLQHFAENFEKVFADRISAIGEYQ